MRRCPACAYVGDEAVCPKDGSQTLARSAPGEAAASPAKPPPFVPPEPQDEAATKPDLAPSVPPEQQLQPPVGPLKPLQPEPMAPPPRRSDRLMGRLIAGRYQIVEKIGSGGMGVVYKAYQENMDRHIALKVLSRTVAEDETTIQRFHQEARAASRLHHPNTITVHDFGQTDDGVLFIAMEYLQGEPLDQTIRTDSPLPTDRVLKIICQVCRSLSEAHRAGVIHRDLKPENIFLTHIGDEADFVKVLDFGVAKLKQSSSGGQTLTKAGTVFGTPKYMSPEQAQSLALDARTDIYSIGIILYELLCGHAPFEAESHLTILVQHVNDTPPPLELPEGYPPVPQALSEIVFRSLEKDPNRRQPAVDDLLHELLDVAQTLLPTSSRPISRTGFIGSTDFASSAGQGVPSEEATVDVDTAQVHQGGTAPLARADDSFADSWSNGGDSPLTQKGRSGVPLAPLIVVTAALVTGSLWLTGRGLQDHAEKESARALASQEPGEAPPSSPEEPQKTAEGEPVKSTPGPTLVLPGDTAAAAAEPAAAEASAAEPAAAEPAIAAPKPPTAGKRPPRRRPRAKKPEAGAAGATQDAAVQIRLSSIPPGAEVYSAHGKFIGLTPLTIHRQRSKTAEKFIFKKRGYQDKETLVLRNKDRRLRARLAKPESAQGPKASLPPATAVSKPDSKFKAFGDFKPVERFDK